MSEWISVKDRMPDTNTRVLAFAYGQVQFGEWDGNQLWFGDEYSWQPEYVTHWMPLPQPPK